MRDTIYALSSGHPPAGVAIIRISGPGVRFGLETVAGAVPAPRVATMAAIQSASGEVLDRGIVLFFPAPHSFTGEDVAELHIHGSRASIIAVQGALAGIEGFRAAEPGEFTRRAFENGKLDLTAVEGLSDLIRAETDAQRRVALNQADGGLKQLYDGWAKALTHARAMIEADIDFSDEDDVPGSVANEIWHEVSRLADDIARHLAGARIGEITRSGFRVALIGSPNVGKSSLLNRLAQREAAIVSDIAGTTRDVVEVRLDIDGHLVLLMDTAGLRDSDNPIELEGIRRSLSAARDADLVIELRSLVDKDHPTDQLSMEGAGSPIVVWTKADLADSVAEKPSLETFMISSRTGAGIDGLVSAISERLRELDMNGSQALPTRVRHVELLKRSLDDLRDALSLEHAPLEVRSELLRTAAGSLGRITGKVDVEDLLGVIFSEFCIGK